MKFLSYIQGFRKGKDAHRLEIEAMKDPFLAESLEGYEAVQDDHIKRIKNIQNQIAKRTQPKRNRIAIWSVAASLLVCISLGSYFFLRKDPTILYSNEIRELKEKEEDHTLANTENSTATFSESPQTQMQQLPANENKLTIPVPDNIVSKSDERVMQDELSEKIVNSVSDYSENEKGMEASKDAIISTEETANKTMEISDFKLSKEAELNRKLEQASAKSVIQPKPEIGEAAYEKYLEKNLVYPTDSICRGIKGTVILEFETDANGTPQNIKILRGICTSTDKEAIRLLKEGCKWKPGNTKGRVTIKF